MSLDNILTQKPSLLITHDGKFHPDDLLSTALLLLLFPDTPIVRSRSIATSQKSNKSIFIYDVGLEYNPEISNFDHHQKGGAGTHRGTEIQYASLGLLWKHFGTTIINTLHKDIPKTTCKEVFTYIEKNLIIQIDGSDTGFGKPYFYKTTLDHQSKNSQDPSLLTMSSFLAMLNPQSIEDEHVIYEMFMSAIPTLQTFLKNYITNAIQTVRALKTLNRYRNGSSLLILKKDLPWREAVAKFTEVKYVIRPRKHDWAAVQVPVEPGSFKGKKPFPKSWRGLEGKELQEATGNNEAVFCHANGFLLIAKSLTAAKTLCELSLKT